MGVRALVRNAAKARSFELFVSLLSKWDRRPNVLRVLMYHRVDEIDHRRDLAPVTLSATPPDFARQIEFLSEHYHVLSLDELLEAKQSGCQLPERSVLVTFDDAYEDFGRQVVPVLQRCQIPVTLFVPTGFPDNPACRFWWDRLWHALHLNRNGRAFADLESVIDLKLPSSPQIAFRRIAAFASRLSPDELIALVEAICQRLLGNQPPAPPAVMGWQQLRELPERLVRLAPHTRQHLLLGQADKTQAREDIESSLHDMQSRIGCVPPAFAYPGGSYNSDTIRILKELGVQLAFTTQRGLVDWRRDDTLRLNRINVGYRCPFGLWRGQLLSASRYFTVQTG